MSEPTEREGKKVSWTVFVWAVGLLATAIYFSFSFASTAKSVVAELDSEVSRIDSRTDAQFAEILRSLDRLEKQINATTK
jgi:hypothetical protein